MAFIPWRELYWLGMTHRIGAKGQVVIPKDLRERTGLHPGAEVEFKLEGKDVVVRASKRITTLGGSLPGPDMAARLLEDRRREPR
jgi:AbrB family looped-hinge helix DNA binding protein